MFWILTLLMLVVPFIEIWVMLELATLVSLTTVIFQCTITMAAGGWLMKSENFSIVTLVDSELRNRRIPTEEILSDMFIWISGVMLLVPGLLTDALGIALIIPVIRQESVRRLRERMRYSLGMNTIK